MTETIVELLAARRFARDGLLPLDYHFPESIDLSVSLTQAGEAWRDRLMQEVPDITPSDATAAILAAFAAGNRVLVDSAASNHTTVIDLLSKEVRERRINYPFIFGRELDDAFVESFGQAPIRTMSPEQTQRLTRITPQGVFQCGSWVSGPYGLLRSEGTRHFRPQTCGPAIRCNKISCHRLHHITMTTSETAAGRAYAMLMEKGPVEPILADQLIDLEISDEFYYTANHPGGLPWLIGNGFTLPELARIAEFMLEKNAGGLRARLNVILGGSAPKKAASVLVGSLGLAELMQLVMLADDQTLTQSFEEAIERKIVALSPTESRRSFENRHLNGGAYSVDAEASYMGVRFLPARDLTQARIIALIEAVFSDENQKELAWQLRGEVGSDATEKLWAYASTKDLGDLVRQLLFSSRESLERAFEHLKYGNFQVPDSQEGEDLLVKKIVWKLGGRLPTPKPPQAAVLRHSQSLGEANFGDHRNEDSRVTATRSAGMNLFPELERLLRITSEFACWALLNDHYDVHPLERFRFSPKRAKKMARSIFAEAAHERGESFPYDADGKNSLAVLIQSFRVLAELCEKAIEDSDSMIRPAWQMPSFALHSDVQHFPLQHTALIADLRFESRQRLIDSLRGITLALTRVDICEVRNDLGHARDKFPSVDRIDEAIQAVRSAIEIADSVGLFPTIRSFEGETVDGFGRLQTRVVDGNGGVITLYSPDLLWGLGLPRHSALQVLLQGAVMQGSTHPARFEVVDDSEWSELWLNVGLINSWLQPSGSSSLVDDDISELLRGSSE